MKVYIRCFLLLSILVLLLCGRGEASIQLTYSIEVNAECSAAWVIEQKGIGVPTPVFDEFVKKVSSLISLAAEKTQRNMTVEGLSMSVNVSGSYKIIRYYFIWKNFAQSVNGKIVMGDVFEVENFFSYLYGDGAVRISYPLDSIVESVSPEPHERDDCFHVLEWYGTADFKIGEPKVSFAKNPDIWIAIKNVFVVSLALLAVGCFIGTYYLKFKRKEKMKEKIYIQKMGNDEEKVISLLRSAGGSLYQSAIADHCGFSRAKASKLLKSMENRGIVKREDKGREKMVTLLEEVKSEKA
jgi:hypothetical protein